MNVFESVGMAWVIFTSGLAHFAIVWAAYKYFHTMQRQAERGAVEEKRDVVEAFKVRETIHG